MAFPLFGDSKRAERNDVVLPKMVQICEWFPLTLNHKQDSHAIEGTR